MNRSSLLKRVLALFLGITIIAACSTSNKSDDSESQVDESPTSKADSSIKLELQNVFVSPFVQGLCNKLENTLEGSAEDFFEFEQQIRAIEEFTGKPGDVDYNDSFVKIIGGAQAYLLSDTRYPGEFGFSYPMTIEACRDLDFTRATWDEGIYATDIEPASQSKIEGILRATCPGSTKKYRNEDELNSWTCDDIDIYELAVPSSRIFYELLDHVREQDAANNQSYIVLCGAGWILQFEERSGGLEVDIREALANARIPATSCRA